MTLRVVPLDDPAAIDAILTDPWIASRLRHDSREPGYVDHPALTYYGAYVDEALVGVFMAIRFTDWEREVHAALRRSALPHSRALASMFIDAMFADPVVTRLTANVLGTLPSAANFVRKVGFADEGCRRDACRVGGVLTDVWVLGRTRAERSSLAR